MKPLLISADLENASGLQSGNFAIKVVSPGRTDNPREASAYVGLEVNEQPPMSIVQVHDLCDANGVVQGDPGYLNHNVQPGDVILAIDGQPTENLTVSIDT